MKRAAIVLALWALAGCGSRTGLDAGAGACDAAVTCVYSCDPGPLDAGGCGNFSSDFPSCVESVSASYRTGCRVTVFSECAGLADASCVCNTFVLPATGRLVRGWACPR
jgi:hypothetical protein